MCTYLMCQIFWLNVVILTSSSRTWSYFSCQILGLNVVVQTSSSRNFASVMCTDTMVSLRVEVCPTCLPARPSWPRDAGRTRGTRGTRIPGKPTRPPVLGLSPGGRNGRGASAGERLGETVCQAASGDPRAGETLSLGVRGDAPGERQSKFTRPARPRLQPRRPGGRAPSS